MRPRRSSTSTIKTAGCTLLMVPMRSTTRVRPIKSVHPAVFIVEVDERRGRKSRQSYQYIDVLTGQVELFDPESGEHIFTPLGNQLEEH